MIKRQIGYNQIFSPRLAAYQPVGQMLIYTSTVQQAATQEQRNPGCSSIKHELVYQIRTGRIHIEASNIAAQTTTEPEGNSTKDRKSAKLLCYTAHGYFSNGASSLA